MENSIIYEWDPQDDMYSSRKGSRISNIIIHSLDTCPSEYCHYVVEDRVVKHHIGDSFSAWSLSQDQKEGDTLTGATNRTSLSVGVSLDSDQEETLQTLIELIKNLMRKFNIPHTNVFRHYDISHKLCPSNLSDDNWELWWKLKSLIQDDIFINIDLSKSNSYLVKKGQLDNLQRRLDIMTKDITKKDIIKVRNDKRVIELPTKEFEGKKYVQLDELIESFSLEAGYDLRTGESVLKDSE